MSLAERISNAELEVLRILWREKKPVPFTEIRVELQHTKGWEKSTVNTLLRRLTGKEVITALKQDMSYYTPNISEAEYIQAEEQSIIDKLYNGNAKNLVAALCRRGSLSEDDIDELKAYFHMGGSKNE